MRGNNERWSLPRNAHPLHHHRTGNSSRIYQYPGSSCSHSRRMSSGTPLRRHSHHIPRAPGNCRNRNADVRSRTSRNILQILYRRNTVNHRYLINGDPASLKDSCFGKDPVHSQPACVLRISSGANRMVCDLQDSMGPEGQSRWNTPEGSRLTRYQCHENPFPESCSRRSHGRFRRSVPHTLPGKDVQCRHHQRTWIHCSCPGLLRTMAPDQDLPRCPALHLCADAADTDTDLCAAVPVL